MEVIDKYLRNRHSATRTLDHFLALFAAHGDVSLFEADIFAFKQGFRPEAEAAGKFCIYFNFRHISLFLPSVRKWAVSERNSSNRYLFRNLAIFKTAYNPCPTENEHFFGTRFLEQPSAGIARGSAGVNVINQQNRFTGET